MGGVRPLFGDGVTGNVVPVTPAGIGGEIGSERGRSLAFAVRMERHEGLGCGLSACSWRRGWEERTREGGVVAIGDWVPGLAPPG